MNSRDESLNPARPSTRDSHPFASLLSAADVNVNDLDLHMSHAIAKSCFAGLFHGAGGYEQDLPI